MRRIILTLIIVLLIFTYIIPEKNAEQIPYGPQIQTTIRTILKPVQNILEQAIGSQVSQMLDSAKQQFNDALNGQKIQLENQVTDQINKSINNAVPTIPSKK